MPGAYLTQISSDSRFPSAGQSQPEKSLQSWESACDLVIGQVEWLLRPKITKLWRIPASGLSGNRVGFPMSVRNRAKGDEGVVGGLTSSNELRLPHVERHHN